MAADKRSSTTVKAASKIQSVASEELNNAATLARQSIASQAYLYPFKGIFYFVSHSALWKPLLAKLTPLLTLGVSVTGAMFIFTYLPQAAVLAFVEGPLAALSAVLLVLSESSTIINFIGKGFLVEDALVDTFDGTLLSKQMTTLVEPGRTVKSGGDPIAKLGKIVKKPFMKFTPTAIIRYFMYLPLNFIPVVGTALFIILQGRRSGPAAHARYFQLKGMSSGQREQFVQERQAAYASFGVPATLLEMVPVVGIFFAFTNQVGAALWAADLEGGFAEGQTTAPGLKSQVRAARDDEGQESGSMDL